MEQHNASGLQFLPVTPQRWESFKALFQTRGAPHYCWCMAWRKLDPPIPGQTPKERRRASIKRIIKQGTPTGILAYLQDQPVAWCSVAPRSTYKNMGGQPTQLNVWSIACFFVLRKHRRTGIARALLQHAVQHARSSGAQRLEAYPPDQGATSYRFMGSMAAFEQAGFKHAGRAGTRRNIMILDLQ